MGQIRREQGLQAHAGRVGAWAKRGDNKGKLSDGAQPKSLMRSSGHLPVCQSIPRGRKKRAIVVKESCPDQRVRAHVSGGKCCSRTMRAIYFKYQAGTLREDLQRGVQEWRLGKDRHLSQI